MDAKNTTHTAKRAAFTMIEMLFVIVLVGALAGIATTWLFQTRLDAQVAVFRSDIASLLKQVPSEVVASDISVNDTPPPKFASWGEWLMHIGALDRTRWKASGNGVQAISFYHKGSERQIITCEGNYLYVDTKLGQMKFTPSTMNTNVSAFCTLLAKSFERNGAITLELRTAKGLSFN